MKQTFVLVVLSALLGLSPALGQGAGTPEDHAACAPDVKKYCTAEIKGGDMAILACLQQNRSRISKACQQVLIKYGQ